MRHVQSVNADFLLRCDHLQVTFSHLLICQLESQQKYVP